MRRRHRTERDAATHNSPSPRPNVSSHASNTLWRVFCAIELSEEVCSQAAGHIEKLQKALAEVSASWNRDGKFHLTIKFLGNISPQRAQDISRAAAQATAGLSPFQIIFKDAGSFPKQGAPRVLWLGIADPSGKLMELHERLEDQSADAGFPREERSFNPHLTLARLRKPQGARTLAAAHKDLGFGPVKDTISELLVLRSELSSEGSKYTILSRHALKTVSDEAETI